MCLKKDPNQAALPHLAPSSSIIFAPCHIPLWVLHIFSLHLGMYCLPRSFFICVCFCYKPGNTRVTPLTAPDFLMSPFTPSVLLSPPFSFPQRFYPTPSFYHKFIYSLYSCVVELFFTYHTFSHRAPSPTTTPWPWRWRPPEDSCKRSIDFANFSYF